MKCGIVILNYNDYHTTEELLSKIKDCPEIDNIVVVDNASPNDSYTRLKKYESPKVAVIQSDKNGGYSCGNNVGIRYLIKEFHPDIIGIANPDTEFDGAFVNRIKECFAKYPDYAILTGFQVKLSGATADHPFWEALDTPMKMYCSVLSGIFFKKASIRKYMLYCEEIRNSSEELHQVGTVEGSLFFIQREDFEKVGLFDENVFLYGEEDILAFKLHKLGRKIGIINTVQYVHNHKTPANNALRDKFERGMQSLKYQEASSSYYFSKYVTGSKFLQIVYALMLKSRYFRSYIGYSIKWLLRRS